MRTEGKHPETDKDFYKRRLSEYGRKAFEVAASALFFYFVDWVIHTLLVALNIPSRTKPGSVLHDLLKWTVGAVYLIYVSRLLLPDASEQIAETREQIKTHWFKKRTTRGRKP